MKLNRLTGRRIGAAAVLAAVITCGGLALASAASAAPTVASATTHSATHSAAVQPRTADGCTQYLGDFGYRVTTARAFACHIAALGKPNPHTAIIGCIASLTISGVTAVVATVACGIGSIAG
jgi:hypothetical protein